MSEYTEILFFLATVFFLSFALNYFLVSFPLKFLQDASGARSLHVGVIPRSGGVAIVIAFAVGLLWYWPVLQTVLSPVLLMAALLLCLISFSDDLWSVPPLLRLLIQLIVAALVIWGEGLFFQMEGMGYAFVFQILSLLALVWMINLYNFMDGMDGFAASMAVLGFSALAVTGLLVGDSLYALLCGILVAAVGGFLCWNAPPARIFMGDLGSTLLGFLVGVLALLGWQRELFPLWVPALIFSPFWVDASYTLLKRLVKKEAFWLPHRSHFYQRWVLCGYSHRQVTMWETLLMLACALSALLPPCFGLGYNDHIPLIWLGIYAFLLMVMEQRLTSHKK